jgi:hypothetical protein
MALSACLPDTFENDRPNYLRAISMTPGEEAEALCLELKNGLLRGECQAYNAEGVAATGDQALVSRLCGSIEAPVWREECFFLTTDRLDLTGDGAVEACANAGRYRGNCVGHAIGREMKGIERRFGKVGQETMLYDAILKTVSRYKPGAPPAQRKVTADSLMARILASRWNEAPFDKALCGKATDALCARAYRTNLDAAPPQIAIEGLCDRPVTLQEAEAIGARTWTPDSEELARVAWAQLCTDLRSGKTVRDGSRGMGPPPIAEPGILPGEMVRTPAPGATP